MLILPADLRALDSYANLQAVLEAHQRLALRIQPGMSFVKSSDATRSTSPTMPDDLEELPDHTVRRLVTLC